MLFLVNKDISITTLLDIAMNFFMKVIHIFSEGSVSQNFCLGPSFYLGKNVLKITK